MCYVSLCNFVKKKKAGAPVEKVYKKNRLVFKQEAMIAEYLLKRATIYFGLLQSEVNKLAHQFAIFYKIENVHEFYEDKSEVIDSKP